MTDQIRSPISRTTRSISHGTSLLVSRMSKSMVRGCQSSSSWTGPRWLKTRPSTLHCCPKDWSCVFYFTRLTAARVADIAQELGSYFGAHSVHAGLWESATETAHSLSARIAIIHLVSEGRGIDMNPLTMARLKSAGDKESSRVLEIIHADEITRELTLRSAPSAGIRL